MNIKIRKSYNQFTDVIIESGDCVIAESFYGDVESNEIAEVLLSAVEDIGPHGDEAERVNWIIDRMKNINIGVKEHTHSELVAIIRELREVLLDLSRYPVARSYPDSACLEQVDMDDVKAALTKTEDFA